MMVRSSREAGQAAPIYITMVAGLLFLALAFFAVGQAGATRNGAQSAADAAALAAAQESRDQFGDILSGRLLDAGFLDDIFNGNPVGTFDGCAEAHRFADENDATVDLNGPAGGCSSLADGRWGFTVDVITQDGMGESVLPGTADEKAKAHATAVVVPRCGFDPTEDDENPGEEEPGEPDEGDEGDEGEEEPVSPGKFVCDGDTDISIDPVNPVLPDLSVLFSVRLAED